MEAALGLFTSQDYDDVSIDELCRRADVSKGLAFYHFKDKRGIYAATLDHIWRDLLEFQSPLPDEDTPRLRIRGYLHRHFEYIDRYPERFTILMTARGTAEVRDVVATSREKAVNEVAASLGCPRSPGPRLRQVIRGWMGFIEGVTVDFLAHRDVSIEDITILCTQSLVASVLAAEGSYFDADAEVRALHRVALTDWQGQPMQAEVGAATSETPRLRA